MCVCSVPCLKALFFVEHYHHRYHRVVFFLVSQVQAIYRWVALANASSPGSLVSVLACLLHPRGGEKRGRGSDGHGGDKKRRAWRDPEDEDDPAVTNGAIGSSALGSSDVGSGAAGSNAVGSSAAGSSAVGSGAVGSGVVGSATIGSEGVVTPTPRRPLLLSDPAGEAARPAGGEEAEGAAAAVAAGSEGLERTSPSTDSSGLNVDGGDAAEMRVSDFTPSPCSAGGRREADAWKSSTARFRRVAVCGRQRPRLILSPRLDSCTLLWSDSFSLLVLARFRLRVFFVRA